MRPRSPAIWPPDMDVHHPVLAKIRLLFTKAVDWYAVTGAVEVKY